MVHEARLWAEHPDPTLDERDRGTPLVDFGQEKAFDPQGRHQWLSYLLIVTGWLLATTIAAGITRSVGRP
ncbi:hypothetical protein FHX80_115502 [Streptomyces brevispora]|uniref:Uncharacterized protein n=1 Tax=Streptomyces brevispora TaxID=887462 RepID=A0A561V5W6_9ACTN|nr:hypothetical protein FHX80_115502 [Streptomyces brevispora]